MLAISTPQNPPLSSVNPLEDRLRTRDKGGAGPSTNSRMEPARKFFTTPLFHNPMSHKHPIVPLPLTFSRPSLYVHDASDDFDTFVLVAPSLDPLSSSDPPSASIPSSHSVEASSSSENQPNTATAIMNEFTIAARQGHAENANRIMGELLG
jgi:hypothetical protein